MTPLDPRVRDAEELGVSPDADAATARAAFLRRLAETDFLPPEAAVSAVNRLGEAAVPLTPDARAREALALRAEVEAFASDYWSLTAADRRARWDELSERSHDTGCRARLQHLAAGLDLVVTPHPDPDVEELAGVVRELYALAPRPRAIRRAEWLADRAAGTDWEAVTLRHRDADPATAGLVAAAFASPLAIAGPMPQAVERVMPVTVERRQPMDEYNQRALDDFGQRVETWRENERNSPSRPGLNLGGVGWIMVLMVLGGFLRGLASCTTTSPSPGYRQEVRYQTPANFSNYPPLGRSSDKDPRWSPESSQPRLQGIERQVFTAHQIAAFEAYDPKSGRPAPLNYELWRALRGHSELLKNVSDPSRHGLTVPTFRR